MEATETRTAQETITVGQLIERYLRGVQLAPQTLAVRRRCLQWSFADHLDVSTYKLSGAALETIFLAKKDTAGGFWVNCAGAAIKALFKWGVSREVIERDVSKFWPKVATESQRSMDPITSKEAERLIAESPRALKLFCLFGFFAGFRRANIAKADWSWVSEDWMITIPKGQFKQRVAHTQPLHSRIIEEIKADRKPSGLIIEGLPSESSMGRALTHIAKTCGIDERKIFCHAMRAAFATRLSESGANLKQICDLGGWKSIEVLASRYIRKMDPTFARGLLEKM